jgi:tetratricopeptide (TPR) repeat protein
MRGLILIVSALVAFAVPVLAQEGAAPMAGDPPAVEVAPKKPAEVRAEALDTLFAKLYLSDGAGAQGIEQKIWALWGASDSATAEVLLQQSGKAIDAGAPAEALSILDRLIGAYPNFAEAWNKRATLYFMMKKDDASLKDIEHVLDLEPRHFGALAGRGMILQRQKKYSAALESYQQALKINPGLDAVKDSIKQLERLEQGI